MRIRVGYLILLGLFLSGCSDQGEVVVTDEIAPKDVEHQLAESNPGDVTAVFGALFEVDNFDDWLAAYNKSTNEAIILLRSINDPSIVMVFEGGKTREEVTGRAVELKHEDFLEEASIVGEPFMSYYDIKYMSSSENEMKHYVGLAFGMEDFDDFMESLKENICLYHNYGLVPLGIGTDFERPEEIFMLLSLEDFVTFRKRTNSPRKIHNFTNSLKLPESTLLSTWSKSKI